MLDKGSYISLKEKTADLYMRNELEECAICIVKV